MGKNTDNKLLIMTQDITVGEDNVGNDFIKNFNRINSNQLSVVESDEQIGLELITRIINSYEAPNSVNIESVLKKLGYNEETSSRVIAKNMTISEYEFQDRLYDYYIAPF